MEYRKEIDGLRAVAVLSVVLCHAGFTPFAGGFVGVDVFFVISGFLITTILLGELQNGSFSLKRFYERRARRILPALFGVILATLPAAWLWLLPQDFRDYARSLVYVVLFASNIHFYKEIGYFEPNVELRPLLHTWSLGVEEQYYLIFPLLMLSCWRLGRPRLLTLLSLLALISLGVGQYGLARFPEASFYLLPTRAWELLAGAGYAVVSSGPQPLTLKSSHLKNLLGGIGLSLILAAIFLYSPETPFPGIAALVPVLGSVLVIAAATPDTLAGKLLATRPAVLIGLWSYSIYLWHQPVFAFARYHMTDNNDVLMLVLVGVTLGLGYLSWRYVEMPFRKPIWSGRKLARLVLSGIALFLIVGVTGRHRSDLLKQLAPGYATQAEVDWMVRNNYGLAQKCDSADAGRQCQTSDMPEILLWGDSYAMHLADGIVASRPDAKLIQRTENNCAPMLGIAPVINGNIRAARACLQFNQSIIDMLAGMPTISHVVLASPFSQYLKPGNGILAMDSQVVPADSSILLEALRATLARLEEMKVQAVLVAPPPANGMNIGKCLARLAVMGKRLDHCDFPVSELSETRRQIYELLRKIDPPTRIVWLNELMCPEGLCASHADAVFLFADDGHISRDGSSLLGRKHDFHQLIVGRNAPATGEETQTR